MIRRVVIAALVLACGLAVRAFTEGVFAKYAGVALYATFVYALVMVVAPRMRPWVAAGVALAFCWAVEFAQLTPGPAWLSARSGFARLVFGTTFNPPDLFWYAVGAALGALVYIGLSRSSSRTTASSSQAR